MRKLMILPALLLAVAIGAALAAPVGAAPVFVDLGSSLQPTPGAQNYNHIFVDDTTCCGLPYDPVLSVPNMIDNTGAPTGIGLTASGFFQGDNSGGTTAPTGAAAIFHSQATRDSAFGHAAAFGSNPLTPQGTLALTGLDPLMKYNFTFLSSRAGLGATPNNRETEYTVNGSNSGGALLNASNNTSNVATVLGIFPTGAGNINVLVDPGPNNTSPEQFYYVNAMRLECVPEPASGALLMLGVVGFFIWQRHRGGGQRS